MKGIVTAKVRRRAVLGAARLQDALEVFHNWKRIIEVVQQRPPVTVLLGLPEPHGMVFESFPFHKEQIRAR